MSVSSSFPIKQRTATEKSDGLMSAKDKKNLNNLIKQMAEVVKTLANIPSDKLNRSSEDILVDEIKCGKLDLNGDIVTMNLNLTCNYSSDESYIELFTLPKQYIPTEPLYFAIPIIVGGRYTDIETLIINIDGRVICKLPIRIDAISARILTSISYIK